MNKITMLTAVLLLLASPARAQEEGPSEVEQFFGGFWDATKNLAEPANLMRLGAGAGVSLAIAGSGVDERLLNYVRSGDPLGAQGLGEMLGNWQGLVAFAIGGFVIDGEYGRKVVQASLLSSIVTHGLKHTVRRKRPTGGAANSWPSGHTSLVFSVAEVTRVHYGWKAGVPLYALAIYTGESRLDGEHHRFSEVVMGAIVGVVAGRAVGVGGDDEQWLALYADTQPIMVGDRRIGQRMVTGARLSW